MGARGKKTGAAARAPAAGPATLIRHRLGLIVAVLVATLACYAALAADVVHGGAVSELDVDVASWVARSMPTWAEWLARPFTWLGGVVGITVVFASASVILVRRGAAATALLLLLVTLGIQLIVASAKNGYERARPDVGSAIQLPSSYAFPSGHAATGMAVFGLLGLVVASRSGVRGPRTAAMIAGFGLGILVGASRVVLNVHFVSDVVAGWCMGAAWLALCLVVVGLVRR